MEGILSEVFITHVGEEGPLLKIWGQTDRSAPTTIERLIGQFTPKFNQGVGTPVPTQLAIGQLCCAKYLDGTYYRARITSLENLASDQVGVQFADYGNSEVISVNNIRILDGMLSPLATYADQATHFYLANVAPLTGNWSKENLKFVKDTSCYMELKFLSVGKVGCHHFIRVHLQNGMDLAEFLVSRRIAVNILLDTQGGILHNILNKVPLPQMQLWPRFNPDIPPPLPIAQMMVTQSTAQAVEDNVLEHFSPQFQSSTAHHPTTSQPHVKPPSSRLVYPGRDKYCPPFSPPAAQFTQPAVALTPPHVATTSPSGLEVAGFEVRRLALNTPYSVRVVYVEDGPQAFIVFLQDMEEVLAKMLADINAQRAVPLSAPPMTGTICLGRSRDLSLLRAVVVHVADTCKLYFVDFGTTEEVAFDDIFAIPTHYVANPKPMCVRITHGGLNTFELTKEMKDMFSTYVIGKSLTLYTTAAEGHHLKQCGILFDQGKSVLNIVKLQIDSQISSVLQRVPTPQVGMTKSVTVQHIESMRKFFVVLEDNAQFLLELMTDLAKHCQSAGAGFAVTKTDLCEGFVCCARYVTDQQWYRAQVEAVVGVNSARVQYVDYGNCETVDLSALRLVTPELTSRLKAQAIECCLEGYEENEGDESIVDRFSELVVDKTLIAYVVKHTSRGVPVVNLHDLSATPLLSVCAELEKVGSFRKGQAAGKKEVSNQPIKPAQNADSKYRSGASEEADWRARPAATSNGRMDTWEGSRESKAAAGGFAPPNIGSGDVKAAQLVYTENPEDFYVQITPDTALVDLMADIALLYGKGGHPLPRPSRGASCVARFADDGEWYRATVQSADSSTARVMFVDYGNVDDVPLADVREIAPAFVRLPAQAVRCCLSGSLPKGAEWTAEEISQFTEMMDGKPLEMKFGTERNGVYSVHVTDAESGQKINDKFSTFVDKPPPPFVKAASNQSYSTQSHTFDKPERNGGKPERIGDKPERNYERPERNYEKQERNYEKPERNYERQERSFDKPSQSYDKPDRSAGFDRQPQKDFANAKPAPVRKQEPVQVQEFARPNERLSVVEVAAADCQEVGVTWFISPEEFYVGQASTVKDFDTLMREMQSAYRSTRPIVDSLEVGAPCVAVFAEDKSFCRAEVVAAPNAHAHVVRFVDYGNSDLISKKNLFPIESRFLRLPKVAVLCSLQDVKPAGEAWPKASDDIDALFRKDKYQCTFHEVIEGKYSVSLTHGTVDVASALVEKGLGVRPLPPAPAAPAIKEEPIERDLLVGQTLRVNITYVEAVAKFYVHFSDNRVDEIQAAVDAHVAQPQNKRAFPAAEVQVDRMCIASADGTQWYRARIVDCTGTAGIFVTFLDYGDGDEVTADKMLAMPDALAVLPAQAVECALVGSASADLEPDVEDAFKTAVEGHNVLITVTAFLEGRLSVHMFNLDGSAQPLVASISDCPPSTGTLRSLPMVAQHVAVFVSHADDVHNVWLQKSSEADQLADLLGELYTFYEEEESGLPLASAEVGSLCAARAVDEQWYRAIVLERSSDGGDSISVRFLDYGNMEDVPTEHVRTLDARFMSQHEYAVHVRLPLLAAERNVDLVAMTAEVTYVAAFARSPACGAHWLAELFHERETFSDSLVELGFELVPDYPFANAREKLTRSPKLVPGLVLPVFVSHVGGPRDLWIQLESNVDAIEQLQEKLQLAADGLNDITVPVVGDLAAAIFSEDESWYRAEVLVANDSAVTVRFVDYGNTDVVNILTKPLKRLPPRLANVERFASRCELNVSPIDREFGSDVTNRIQALISTDNNPLQATVVKEGNVIDLAVGDNKSVFQCLTEEALVIEYYDPNTVFVSHVISPADFYVQYQSATFQLEAMTERMTEAADFDPMLVDSVGALCAAKFVDDEAWYRAKITGASGEGTQVFFIDFGNSAVATELRALPEDLLVPPPVAKRCSLLGGARFSAAAAELFVDMTTEASFVVEVLEFADPVQVELRCDGKKVSETLLNLSEATGGKAVEVFNLDSEKKAVEIIDHDSEKKAVEIIDLDSEKKAVEIIDHDSEEAGGVIELESNDQAVQEIELQVAGIEETVDDEEEKGETGFVSAPELPDFEEAGEGSELQSEDVEKFAEEESGDTAIVSAPEFPGEGPETNHEDSELEKDDVGTVLPPVFPSVETLEASDDSYESAKGDNEVDASAEESQVDASAEESQVDASVGESQVDAKQGAKVEEVEEETEVAVAVKAISRPENRIVPGSICRGLSEEELAMSMPGPGDVCSELEAPRSPSPEFVPAIERPRSCPATSPDVPVTTPTRLRHGERIVPGSISCNVSMDFGLDFEVGQGVVSGVDGKTQVEVKIIGQGDEAVGSVVNGNH